MCDRIDRIDADEIRVNFAKLVNAYNVMKLQTSEKIRVLETELKKSNGFIQNIKSRERNSHRKELEYLRCELDQLKVKMKANKALYEIQMNEICSNNLVCTCSQNSSTTHSPDAVSVGTSASVQNDSDGHDDNASHCNKSVVVKCSSCIANRTQLEELNLKICDLTEELQERTAALQGCEQLNRVQSKILHRERINAEEKDRDLTKLADELKDRYIDLKRAWYKQEVARERICLLETELSAKTDLSNRLNEAEEELAEVRKCVTTATDEIKNMQEKLCEKDQIIRYNDEARQELQDEIECLRGELCEKNQIIDVNAKIKQELEDQLIGKGEELEKLKIFCNDLTTENDKLKNNLDCQVEKNYILSNTVQELNESIVSAREREHYERKRLETCAEKLKASVKEIESLNLEGKYVIEQLNYTKQQLEKTELNLIEVTVQNEKLQDKLCCMTSEMTSKCQQLEQMNSLAINNEINVNNQESELNTLKQENQKQTDVNKTLCNRLDHLQFELTKSRERQRTLCYKNNNRPETEITVGCVKNCPKRSACSRDETSTVKKVHFGMQIALSPPVVCQPTSIPEPVLLPINHEFKCLDCVPSKLTRDSDKSYPSPCETDKSSSADSQSLCDCSSSSADSENSSVRSKMARKMCDFIAENEKLKSRLEEEAETIKSCQRKLCDVEKNNTDRENEIKYLSEHIEKLNSAFKSQEQALRCQNKMLERKVCIKDEQIQSIKDKTSRYVRNLKQRVQETDENCELVKQQLQTHTEEQSDQIQSTGVEVVLKKKTVASRKIRNIKKNTIPATSGRRNNFISPCHPVKIDERHAALKAGAESKSSLKAHNKDTKTATTPISLRTNNRMEMLKMSDSVSNNKPLGLEEKELAKLLGKELARQLDEQICEKKLREEQFRGFKQQTCR